MKNILFDLLIKTMLIADKKENCKYIAIFL